MTKKKLTKKNKLQNNKFKEVTRAAIDNMDELDLIACEEYFLEMYKHTKSALDILRDKIDSGIH